MHENHLKWFWTLSACSVSIGRGRRCRHWWAAVALVRGPMGRLPSLPAEVQLKPKHQPYKLGRQWPELLLRFTDAPDDDVAMGQCCRLRVPVSGVPWAQGGAVPQAQSAPPGRGARDP